MLTANDPTHESSEEISKGNTQLNPAPTANLPKCNLNKLWWHATTKFKVVYFPKKGTQFSVISLTVFQISPMMMKVSIQLQMCLHLLH